MKAIIRLPEVKARTGLSRSTIYARIKSGDFPRAVSLGPRAVGWVAGDIDAWITARIEAEYTAGGQQQ
jgi:prophage regulatory protein